MTKDEDKDKDKDKNKDKDEDENEDKDKDEDVEERTYIRQSYWNTIVRWEAEKENHTKNPKRKNMRVQKMQKCW